MVTFVSLFFYKIDGEVSRCYGLMLIRTRVIGWVKHLSDGKKRNATGYSTLSVVKCYWHVKEWQRKLVMQRVYFLPTRRSTKLSLSLYIYVYIYTPFSLSFSLSISFSRYVCLSVCLSLSIIYIRFYIGLITWVFAKKWYLIPPSLTLSTIR